ncbi:MAG: hypothetical protein N2249_00810 [Melioribacter sp.]|nr:hypothetical protein [Melioribacter sp.]
MKFANYLFNEKDYLRALNEYKEYLKQNQNDTAYFKYAESFLRIGRFEEAAENFKSLFFNSSLEDEAKLEFFKAHFLIGLNSKNFSYFRNLFSKEVYSTTKYYKEIKRLTLISHFFDNSALPDTNEFFSTFDDSNYVSIKNFYLIKKSPKYKNPNKAGILSAILPGLGKIYSGKISDGITSFITTCLFTFFSIDNFKHNHHFRGWLFAGLSAITYAGNIYGSIASTHIYNARLKNDFNNKIKYYFEERNFLLPNIEFVNR